MTVEEGVQKILEVERETGLYIPVCWSKEDVEESISDEDWRAVPRIVDKYTDFSSHVIEAIESVLEDI